MDLLRNLFSIFGELTKFSWYTPNHSLRYGKVSAIWLPFVLVLFIRGRVIGPTFHFNVPRLDFGVVAYGTSQIIVAVYVAVFIVVVVIIVGRALTD